MFSIQNNFNIACWIRICYISHIYLQIKPCYCISCIYWNIYSTLHSDCKLSLQPKHTSAQFICSLTSTGISFRIWRSRFLLDFCSVNSVCLFIYKTVHTPLFAVNKVFRWPLSRWFGHYNPPTNNEWLTLKPLALGDHLHLSPNQWISPFTVLLNQWVIYFPIKDE